MNNSDPDHGPSRRQFLATAVAAMASPAILTRRPGALPSPELSLQPLLARPTVSSILLNARNGPADITATVQLSASDASEGPRRTAPIHAAPGGWLEWSIDGLKPGTRYTYAIHAASAAAPDSTVARGGFVTQRTGAGRSPPRSSPTRIRAHSPRARRSSA